MKTLYRLYWVSAGFILAGLDGFLLVIIGVDLTRFWLLGLTLRGTSELSGLEAYPVPDFNFLFVMSTLFLGPVAITLVKYPLRDLFDEYLPETPLAIRWVTLFVHFLVVVPLLLIG